MFSSQQPGEAPADTPSTAVDERLLQEVLRAQQWLQGRQSLETLFDFLLVALPERLGLTAAELLLSDRDRELRELLPGSLRGQRLLAFDKDPLELGNLYQAPPQLEILGFGDERFFRILPGDEDAGCAVLMPIIDAGELVGSYHWGLQSGLAPGPGELVLLRSLADCLSTAFSRVRMQQLQEQFVLLDPATAVGNQRAFRRYLRRELARARRVGEPLSLVLLSVDEQAALCNHYGEAACQIVLKRVLQRLGDDLRESDYLARVAEDRFAVLLPACSEPHGHDIAERMAQSIDGVAIDDGRGGALQSTLSLGVVAWHPAELPSDNLERIGVMLQAEAEAALAQSVLAGGNRVSIARLGALMV
jgi:diguanylate cyclase (GGDEF)-like protein